MFFAYLDASALAKRYVPEPGTASVNHVFHRIPLDRMIVFNVGIAEVVSILVRKRNASIMPAAGFAQALQDLDSELLSSRVISRIVADDQLIVSACPLIQSHSLNSTDAIVLRSALDLAGNFRSSGHDLLLISSDLRLLAAAQAEGLLVFNPEAQSPADLDTLLGP